MRDVLLSRWIGLGSVTNAFEKEFCKYLGVKYGTATNSGTSALHLALAALGIGRGDEVILPALTFVSCAHVIEYCGAKPVFADVEEDNLTIDPEDVRRKLSTRTRAVMAVHYGGNPADLSGLMKICRERDIALVEDAAHACGAEFHGDKVGTLGVGCFSFHAVKNLTTGDGGMVVASSKRMNNMLRRLVWLGITRTTWDRYGRASSSKRNWDYSVKDIGFKYHMNDIMAAIGRVQLSKLDKDNDRRRQIARIYSDNLSTESWISLPHERRGCKSSFHLYPVRIRRRDKLIEHLAKKGIVTSVHYRPLYYHAPYRRYRLDLPETEKAWHELISLPMYPELTAESVEYVTKSIREFGRDHM